jgi:hypothetical protein
MNLAKITNHRSGENLRKMITIPKGADAMSLQNSEAKYVIVGIPEDI